MTDPIADATSLDTLLAALRAHRPRRDANGDPVELDLTELPTFGGEEPRNTSGVWSWDATRLLVGTCADDLRIVDRSDWRPRGRPPLKNARSVLVTIRMTPEERDRLTARARRAGMGLGPWLRSLGERAP